MYCSWDGGGIGRMNAMLADIHLAGGCRLELRINVEQLFRGEE